MNVGYYQAQEMDECIQFLKSEEGKPFVFDRYSLGPFHHFDLHQEILGANSFTNKDNVKIYLLKNT